MNGFVQVPAKGQPMTAQWGADVANGLNAIRSAGQAGMLLTDGPTGTGFAPPPANLRDRRGRSAALLQRQFDLRARVESRVNGDNKEYRLVVEFYHSTDDAVSLSGKSVSYTGGQQTISAGWNNLYTSSWSSDLDESKQYYLNVWIGAELDEDGKWTGFSTNDTRWWISDTQTSHVHSTSGNMALFRHGYLLGSVAAQNSAASVTQKFDGPLMFLDFVELGRYGGGSGSEGDIDGTNYPMPFQYKRTDTEDPDSGEITSSWAIVNNTFYWDGVLKSLSDFTPPATCTVYLCCTQAAPSSSGEAEWQFSIATSPAQATSGGRVVNYKLYDIADNLVTMDYRTTFLEFNSPHKVSYFKVAKYGEQGSVGIISDATNDEYKSLQVVKDGSHKVEAKSTSADANVTATSGSKSAKLSAEDDRVRIDATFDATHRAQMLVDSAGGKLNLSAGSKSVVVNPGGLSKGTDARFHVLRIKDINGNVLNEYDVLSTGDIEIISAQGTVLKDISLQYTNYQLQMTKTKVNLATGQETTEGPSTVFSTELHSAQS